MPDEHCSVYETMPDDSPQTTVVIAASRCTSNKAQTDGKFCSYYFNYYYYYYYYYYYFLFVCLSSLYL